MSPEEQDSQDGPDVLRARQALAKAKTQTSEIDVVLAEQRRLSAVLKKAERKNHFTDKFRQIIRGAA